MHVKGSELEKARGVREGERSERDQCHGGGTIVEAGREKKNITNVRIVPSAPHDPPLHGETMYFAVDVIASAENDQLLYLPPFLLAFPPHTGSSAIRSFLSAREP